MEALEIILEELEAAIRAFARTLLLVLVAIAAAGFLSMYARAETIPSDATRYRRDYVRIVKSEWGIEAPVAALAAQIHQESHWNCRAVSAAGARGCAQFMPATASWIGDIDHDLRVVDTYSPIWAFRAQATYMQWLHARIKASDECDRMAFALAAYNGGLGYVYKRQKLSSAPGQCFGATCDINPGIADASQRENAAYPRRVLLELERLYVNGGWGPGACPHS